jgi:hypothetical protein
MVALELISIASIAIMTEAGYQFGLPSLTLVPGIVVIVFKGKLIFIIVLLIGAQHAP